MLNRILSKGVQRSVSKQLYVRFSTIPALTSGPLAQPHWSTHPHLLSSHEVTPELTLDEYTTRRTQLCAHFPPNTLLIIPGASERLMSNDIPYEFRQNSDFAYLCGLEEPDAVLCMLADSLTKSPSTTLILRQRDPSRELWDGPRCGPERACELFGVDTAYTTEEIRTAIPRLLNESAAVHRIDAMPRATNMDSVLDTLLKDDKKVTVASKQLRSALDQLRLVKSPAEQRLLQRSAQIASAAFNEVVKTLRTGMREHEICARLDFECRRLGGRRLSFPPVVASGHNALTLHYIQNSSVVGANDLVLVDGGTEYNNYCSDITRTIPVATTFTPPQRELYERVHGVNVACLNMLAVANRPDVFDGKLTLHHVHVAACQLLANHLIQMGIVKGTLEQCLNNGSLERFFPHSIGHWLGLDTHDTTTVSTLEPLQEGHCVTIEPGLYIPNDDDIPKEFRGIGIRVEDDAIVQSAKPPLVLTAHAAKTVGDIEALRAEGNSA